MKFVIPVIYSAVASAAFAPPTAASNENSAPKELSEIKPGELHPTNFPEIQAAQEVHRLLVELSPYVGMVAGLAKMNMDDFLHGTPFDWDEQFASKSIERRGVIEAVPLLAQASKILLGFISRVADYSHHDMISSLADTIADYIA
ncbi:hypothetical protein OXX80_002643 [Metschnikowia pulcherrima]